MSNTILRRVNPRVQSGFNKHYGCKYDCLNALSTVLNDRTFMDDFEYLFKNPSEFFVSLRVYPFDTGKFYYGSSVPSGVISDVKLGNKNVPVSSSEDLKGVLFPDGTYYRHMGTYKTPRKYNNFLDFSPYTKLEIYLPFVGIVALDTNLVMGKEIRIFLSMDFDTGIGTYWIVKHEDYQGEREGDLIQSFNAQMGFDIPLGSSNANDNARSMLASGIAFVGGVITSIVTENPLPVMMSGVGLARNSISALQERVSKGCTGSGKSSLVTPSNIYIVRTCAEPTCTQESYSNLKGLPLNQHRRIGDLKGLTVVDDEHLDNFGSATRTEHDMIKSLLKEGIIL